jgi:hypothetical protein
MSQKIINTPNVFATDLDANRRRIAFRNEDIDIVSDHSLPAFYPEESRHRSNLHTVSKCPVRRTAASETGKTITHKLGARTSTSSTIIGPTWNFTASGRRS